MINIGNALSPEKLMFDSLIVNLIFKVILNVNCQNKMGKMREIINSLEKWI